MKKLFLIFFCLFFAFVAFSQTYNLRERYNTLAALSVSMVIVDNSVYIIGATADTSNPLDPMSYIARHNLNGSFDFFKLFKIASYIQTSTNENSLILTKDSTLACVGYCIDASNVTKVLFLNYDTNGNVLYYKTYTAVNSQRFFGKKIIETTDGFYIMGTIQYLNYDVNLFIIKTDTAGNEQWRRFYGSNATDELSSAFIKTSNNRLLIVGEKNNKDYSHDATFKSWNYFLLLDTAGNIVRNSFGIDSNIGVPQSIIETQDGNFVFCTEYALFKNNAVGTHFKGYLSKVDTNFNIIWEKMYGDSSPVTVLYNVIETQTGELIAVGSNYNQILHPYHNNGLVLKTDVNGNQIWSREYRGADRTGSSIETNELHDCEILNNDGSIISCGISQLNGSGDTFPQQAWLLRIDATGCMDNSWCGYTAIEKTIQQSQQVKKVNIYPNPFTSYLSISIQKENLRQATFTITNLVGQTIYHRDETNLAPNYTKMLNLSYLPNGVYLLEVTIDGQRTIKQIIKQ